MNDLENIKAPKIIQDILEKTESIGFQMVSDPLVGSLLNTLAISKPSSRFLELGTGTGVSTAWILNGMDSQSTLLSVENNVELVAIAQEYLGEDSRITFHLGDAGDLIEQLSSGNEQFDMIFADTWAGKYTHFEEVQLRNTDDAIACVIHHDSYSTLNNGYQYLLTWIENNGYRCIGANREFYIVSGTEPDSESYHYGDSVPSREGYSLTQ